MVRLAEMKKKIYTGQGDKGMTSLVGGIQAPKTHLRFEACGTVDELNSLIGLLLSEVGDTSVSEIMRGVQYTLFSVGVYLATDTEQTKRKPESRITSSTILQLEQSIDMIYSELPETKGFVLPGGCRSSALAHVCRTVCRRAEREIFRLNDMMPIEESVLIFMNRLSDLLFVIALHESVRKNDDKNI